MSMRKEIRFALTGATACAIVGAKIGATIGLATGGIAMPATAQVSIAAAFFGGLAGGRIGKE